MSPITGPQALWSMLAPMLAAMPRVGAALLTAPLFPASLFPTLLRGAVGVAFSLFLYPSMAAHMPPAMDALMWLALIGKEVFIGALIGFAVGTLIWVFQSVGAMIDFQVGLANAQIFDPFGGHDAGPYSGLMLRLAVILFVVGGGLQVFASLLFESFHLWPMASYFPSIGERAADFAGGSLGSIAQLIVRLAAPVILALALIDFGFGLVSRVVPQLNVFYFTMPIKGALAALMIALYLSYLVDVVTGQITELGHWLEHLEPVISGR
jgi:type III secretion protein T